MDSTDPSLSTTSLKFKAMRLLHIMPHSTFGISVPAFDQPPLSIDLKVV